MASTTAAIIDGGPSLAPAAAPAASTACGHCREPDARDRCAGCRRVVYCDRDCQKAAWPTHKAICKHEMKTFHGGKPLASTRDFVLEFWQPCLPASFDVGALLPLADDDEDLDEAAAFERCRGAAMDTTFPGYSAAGSDGHRRRLVRAVIERHGVTRRDSKPLLATCAATCIQRICPIALGVMLDAGAQPGDAANGHTILQQALATITISPYVWSVHALPHALESLRLVLAHTQPGDWLIGKPGRFPLECVATSNPAVSQAMLDCIMASPGGFPAHAVKASVGALHMALQFSVSSYVKVLLDAGADPNVCDLSHSDPTQTPLHTLALSGGIEFDAKLSLLLAAGARLEAVTISDMTPLVTAAFYERAAAYDALLAAGARASALRIKVVSPGDSPAAYMTVLHQLAGYNNAAVIQRVLATGVLNVDVRTGPVRFKRTPLHWAAEYDAPRAVGVLLAAGASLAATDTDGNDALGLAIAWSSAKAARLLVEATPPAGRTRYKRAAVNTVVRRHRAATAAPSDAAAAATLAAAQTVAALFDA